MNVKRREAILAPASTLPFALAHANKGWVKALMDDPHLRAGPNMHDGKLTCEPAAAAHGIAYTPAESVLGAPA
jgi:alanine dehydrogenase